MTTDAIQIYDSMENMGDTEQRNIDWEDISCELAGLINDSEHGVILTGRIQTWQGYQNGVAYAEDWDEFIKIISEYEIRLSCKGRQMFIDLIHHDGTHRMEMRRVTAKGYEWRNNNPYHHKSEIASHLANVKGYTKMMFDSKWDNHIPAYFA